MSTTKISLDHGSCCALMQAFLRNPDLLRRWSAEEPRLQIMANILMHTISMQFEASDYLVAVYRSFVTAELKRLEKTQKPNFSCRCPKQHHRESLQEILQQLPPAN